MVHQLRFIFILICSIFILSACQHTPNKTKVLPASQVQYLKQLPLSPILPIPVKGIQKQQLSDTWGVARSAGRRHEGIDIMAPRGTPITSTTEGIIASLQGNTLGGNVVWILGPSGSWHYYAHLLRHKRGLSVGDEIHIGDTIGYVGNSGNAKHTASHLHYGIYLTGKGRGATNPFPYLNGDF
ncbi:M23 family metallopeptidase [Acinetobacter nectaris]|nr:M23 family metallopeptidase [Acinetobacter nectaris]MCF9027778.1 M23 family metallopeptidase [Acinetobacter nectaris]